VRLTSPPGNRVTALRSSIRLAAAGATALDVWAVLLPALSFLQFQLGGQLIVSELLALAILPWLLRSRERLLVPRWLIGLWGAWLVFQIVTDIVVGSAFADWSRGWAAIVFTLIDVAVIIVLVSTPRRARLFALGLAAGGILGYVLAPLPTAATDPWKWAFAGPLAFILAALMSGAATSRRPLLAVGAFAAFGVINAFLQFRSMSGAALITAAYLLFVVIVTGRRRLRLRTVRTVAAGLACYGIAAVVVFVGLNAVTKAGLFGEAAEAKYEAQAGVVSATSPVDASNPLLVLLGGRSEILASVRAVVDSPLLGHGSWAKDAKYVDMQRQGLTELGILGGNQPTDPNLIPAHSYLMQSWIWAGLAGGIFWLAVALLALWLMGNLFSFRTELAPLIAFSTTLLLWNIAFSPYGNTQRLLAAFSIALCLLALRLGRAPDRGDDPGTARVTRVGPSARAIP
jgi:hypothetical protein